MPICKTWVGANKQKVLLFSTLWYINSQSVCIFFINWMDIHLAKRIVDMYCVIHWLSKCLVRVACLWSKMPIFQRAGLRERGRVRGLQLPQAFQYLILLTRTACDLNFVMISSLASKCQDFKLRSLQFHFIKQLKLGIPNLRPCHFVASEDTMTKFKL